jgi:Intracellular proteinase inhibitor
VPLVFSVTNAGRAPVTLQLMGRVPTADFVVTDARTRPVWSLLRGRSMLGALRLIPLGPGQRLQVRQVWDQRADDGTAVAPGDYLIRATLLTDAPGGLVAPPIRVRIVP